MKRSAGALALAFLIAPILIGSSAEAQITSDGTRAVIVSPPVRSKTVIKERRLRRERNPYFAARPTYTAPNNGARANVTFEPYTRWYYPNENSYYPPLKNYPSIRSR